MSVVTLPVSIGEALDKLTILEIKMSKIADERRQDVEKEYTLLFQQLGAYVNQFPYFYRLLREINTCLWNIQDEFHGKDISPQRAAEIAKLILEENDRRFRVKAKINTACSSSLREQKGYVKKRAFVYGHLGLGDMFWMNGAVRYLATAFDEVIVVCKERNLKNVALMYLDDPTIKILSVKDDKDIYPFTEFRKQLEAQGMTVFCCGMHTRPPRIYEFPLSFYDDFGIPRSIRQNYFHIPNFPETQALYEAVTKISPTYVVVHQQSSTGSQDLWTRATERNPDCPVLDVNVNHYPTDHRWFAAAEAVVNQPVLFYKKLLENAKEIYMIESSVYCLTSHLDLSKVEKKFAYGTCDNSEKRIGVFETGV
jgi:hypothetical protein